MNETLDMNPHTDKSSICQWIIGYSEPEIILLFIKQLESESIIQKAQLIKSIEINIMLFSGSNQLATGRLK